MAIKTILTDLGNVTLFFDFNSLIRGFAQRSGLLETEVLRRLNPSEGVFRQYIKGEVDAREFHEYICDTLEMYIKFKDFCDIWCSIWAPNGQVIDLWRKLRANRYRIVLLSNLDELHHGWVTSYFQLEFLHHALYSFELGCEKPEKRIFELAFPHCRCERDEVVFVDDLLLNVEAAQRFGHNTVHFTGDFKNLCFELEKLGVRI